MDTYRGRRRLLALAIAGLAAPITPAIMPPARAATTTVIERGTQFVPKQVSVAPGDAVVWTFESGPSPGHTVTFDDGTDLNPNCPPRTLLLNDCQDTPGEIVQRRFTVPRTYSYFCKIHRASGMVGVVVVAAGSSTTASTAPAATTSTTRPTTTTTVKPSTSTTATTRPLATSSTVSTAPTTTTTSVATSLLQPGEPPPFSDDTSSAANRPGGSKGGSDSGTVALIVGLLLVVSAGGGYLLWRLRPGRP